MADAPAPPEHPPARGGALGVLTKKVGPLPLGVWLVAVAGIGYYLYRRSHPSSATTSSTDSTAPTDQTTYVPPFDAASLSGSGGLGSGVIPASGDGSTAPDGGDGQAGGGGTGGSTTGGGSSGPSGNGVPLVPISFPAPPPTPAPHGPYRVPD